MTTRTPIDTRKLLENTHDTLRAAAGIVALVLLGHWLGERHERAKHPKRTPLAEALLGKPWSYGFNQTQAKVAAPGGPRHVCGIDECDDVCTAARAEARTTLARIPEPDPED